MADPVRIERLSPGIAKRSKLYHWQFGVTESSFSADIGTARRMAEARLLSIKAGTSRARKTFEQVETYYPSEIELLEKTSAVPPYLIQHERADLAIIIGKRINHAESLAESERLIALLDRNGPPRSTLVLSLSDHP